MARDPRRELGNPFALLESAWPQGVSTGTQSRMVCLLGSGGVPVGGTWLDRRCFQGRTSENKIGVADDLTDADGLKIVNRRQAIESRASGGGTRRQGPQDMRSSVLVPKVNRGLRRLSRPLHGQAQQCRGRDASANRDSYSPRARVFGGHKTHHTQDQGVASRPGNGTQDRADQRVCGPTCSPYG